MRRSRSGARLTHPTTLPTIVRHLALLRLLSKTPRAAAARASHARSFKSDESSGQVAGAQGQKAPEGGVKRDNCPQARKTEPNESAGRITAKKVPSLSDKDA